jgi:uncharacterized protein YjbI with pentapeptide repeats
MAARGKSVRVVAQPESDKVISAAYLADAMPQGAWRNRIRGAALQQGSCTGPLAPGHLVGAWMMRASLSEADLSAAAEGADLTGVMACCRSDNLTGANLSSALPRPTRLAPLRRAALDTPASMSRPDRTRRTADLVLPEARTGTN